MGRLLQDQHLRVAMEPPAQNHLLLIAASERGNGLGLPGDLNAQIIYIAPGNLALGFQIQTVLAADLGEICHRHIPVDIAIGENALRFLLGGEKCDSVGHGFR